MNFLKLKWLWEVTFLLVLDNRNPVVGERVIAYNCTQEGVIYVRIQLLQKKEFSSIHGCGIKVVRTLQRSAAMDYQLQKNWSKEY